MSLIHPAASGRVRTLRVIKLLHTLVWALLAACILALPVLAFHRDFTRAFVISGIVIVECLVLAANRGRCPLTNWAARVTTNRADNFDICLPIWLARYNKVIFGTLFVLSEFLLLLLWFTRP